MKKNHPVFLIAAILSFPLSLSAQGLCPFIGPDLYLPCGQSSTTLTADFSNCPGGPGPSATTTYSVSTIPFAPQAVGGTNVPLGDDAVSGVLPIGFSFCFFGNTYTQFYIGSNGWIGFSAGQPTTFTSAAVPSVAGTVPKNCIMGAWMDWWPPGGGNIRYQLQGTAPCRRLVVSWTNIAFYNNGTCPGVQGTMQIVIFESTNIIETHITSKPVCVAWAGGTATQALHNLAGTVAIVAPGRNSTQWNAVNDARRWTPSGAAVVATPTWYQVGNPVAIGTGLTINVTPPPGGAQYTCHPVYPACYAGYAQCMGLGGSNGPDTILVVPGPPNVYPTIPGPYDFCPGTTITVGTDQPYAQYLWSDGSTGPTLTSGVGGPISVDVIDINGCTGTANAVLNMWPNPVLNVVPVNPAICPNESIQMTVSGANTYVWAPAGSLDNPTSNVVNATPTSTTLYSVVGTDVNGCVDSTFNTVTVLTPPTVVANISAPGVCPTFSATVDAIGAVNYVWTPAATMATPNSSNSVVTPVANTTYQVIGTDANGCSDTDAVSLVVYDLPVVNFSAPVVDGCAPVMVNFQNNSTIASGTIATYVWDVEGQASSNQTNPTYTFTAPGAFDVQLTATSDQGCVSTLSIADFVNVYSIPVAGFNAAPNPADLNATVDFINTSSLDAVNFLWDLGGLASATTPSTSYQFGVADTFTVTLYVSTIHGCSDTTSQTIIINDVTEVWVPCGFTPGNQDGLNDTWFPVGRDLGKSTVSISVEVFDRWGMSVYVSNTPDKPWTGKNGNTANDCPQDVYVYKVYYKNEKGEDATYTGHVTLLR
jgi:gliding motility-associated-like protein